MGSDPELLRKGNGAANERAFASAKRAGVKRSVYISVASEVAACEENWLPFAKDEFSAYFAGKREAERAAADAARQRLADVDASGAASGAPAALPSPARASITVRARPRLNVCTIDDEGRLLLPTSTFHNFLVTCLW